MTRESVLRTDGKTVDVVKTEAENNPLLTRKMENNSSGQPVYIGEAWPGTATSAIGWRIKKMEYDNGDSMPPTGEVWASGTPDFDKEWDERDSYLYS